MKKDDISCYGKFPAGGAKCRRCIYRKSCTLYTETEGLVESLSGLPTFDCGVDDKLPDYSHIPGATEEMAAASDQFSVQFAAILRYLLSMDNYTLGLIADIVAPENSGQDPAQGISISQLARHRNCSRQAIHRKLLAACDRHPELSSLFQTTLRKLGGIKSHFRRCGERL